MVETNKLSDRKIAGLTERGLYGDGRGLWLQISAFQTKAWILRFMMDKRARSMGLGPYPEVSLKKAREQRAKCRQMICEGIDPIEARKAKRMAARVEFRQAHHIR